MELSYITRGNASPQGKSRVYISHHPEDSEYVASVAEDIFVSQNCAVYYSDGFDVPEGLQDMQLFVVIVTEKFLFTSNHSRDYEYGFAFENHIPVLPVLVEEGIEDYFSETMNRIHKDYGNIQFLNRNAGDATEIPYREKLNKYLSRVLVGDELAERIRAAFDAYIFLSYRKKDRRYARELMNLIHEIDFCRDIAIWYDEFLVPGEEWRRNIESALDKSAFMAMMITPNVTEKGNYIITTEYPKAIEKGKKILPLEIVDTNHETLREIFPGISDIINARNPEELSNSVKECFSDIKLREKDSPEHNYLIGLAYLNGIDTERNNDIALKLITSSAEHGYFEAMSKLSSMYECGDGVSRDYEMSAVWLERVCALCRRNYESEKDFWNLFPLLITLTELADSWIRLAFYTSAEICCDEIRSLVENFKGEDSETLKMMSAVSYERLGHILSEKGKLKEAEAKFMNALKISRELGKDDLTESLCSNIGELLKEQGHLKEAEEFYREALNLKTSSPVYLGLGCIAEAKENLSEASDFYMKALDEAEREFDETRSHYDLMKIANICGKLNGVLKNQGRHDEALKYSEREIEISLELSENPGILKYRQLLALSYNHHADILADMGMQDEAMKFYLMSLDLNTKLCNESGSLQAKREMSVNYHDIGNISVSMGRIREAENFYLQSLSIRENLIHESKSPNAFRDLSVTYSSLSDILTFPYSPRLNEAKDYRHKAMEIDRRLVSEYEDPEYIFDLLTDYESLGNIAIYENNNEEGLKHYGECLKICRSLAENIGTRRLRRNLFVILNKNGDASMNLGELEKAESFYAEGLMIAIELYEESKTPDSARDLCIVFTHMGELNHAKGNDEETAKFYARCISLSRDIMLQSQSLSSAEDYALSLYRLSCIECVPYKERYDCISESLKLYEILCKQSDSRLYKERLDMARRKFNEISNPATKDLESCIKSAEEGNPGAQYLLALRYESGTSVEVNEELSAQWCMKAAVQNFPPAENMMGNLYYNGRGVEKDRKKAVEWTLRAAEHGHPGAQWKIGDLYISGDMHPGDIRYRFHDVREGVKWLEKSAAQGYQDAIETLDFVLKTFPKIYTQP